MPPPMMATVVFVTNFHLTRREALVRRRCRSNQRAHLSLRGDHSRHLPVDVDPPCRIGTEALLVPVKGASWKRALEPPAELVSRRRPRRRGCPGPGAGRW